MELNIQLNSDMGCVRTNNEDMLLVAGETYRDTSDAFRLSVDPAGRFVAAVADGMGGHNAGEVASEMVLEAFDKFIVGLPSGLGDSDFRHLVDQYIKSMHRRLYDYGLEHPEAVGLGTTLAAWLTYEGRIYLLNCGDSRIYRLRNAMLVQLTTDHSEINRTHDPTMPSNLIYNCLGGGGATAFADVVEISNKVFAGDVFMLCSDGVSDMIDDDAIEQILNKSLSAQAIVEAAKAAGGRDNASAIVLKIE